MKDILRTAVGVIFSFFFLVLLLLSAIKFEVLRADYWAKAVERSGFYQEVEKQMADWQTQINKQNKGRKLVITGVVTEARARDVIQTNIERLTDYLNGKTEKLLVYLPVNEWKISRELTSGLPWKINQWSKETEVKVLALSLGMKAEEADQLDQGVSQIQGWMTKMGSVWLGLVVICLILLSIHYVMGRGRGKAKGSLWLMVGSGLLAGSVGLGGVVIGKVIAQGQSNLPVWVQSIMAELVSGFFRFGGSVGGVLLVVSIVGLLVVGMMKRTEEEKEPMVKRMLKLMAGTLLGALILVALLAGVAWAMGGAVNFSFNAK